MIVLGIDPGIANTGYGVVASGGSRLELDRGRRDRDRRRRRARAPARGDPRARRRADRRASTRDALAVEELYFGANVRTAFAVGQARGVVLLAAGQHGVPSRSYTPQQVKAAVCGNGHAGKEQVARMVARLLGLPAAPARDHAADALAVAICELNRAPLAATIATAARAARGPSDGGGARDDRAASPERSRCAGRTTS